jgi:NADH-quinone oxidoreductase subunit N
MGKFWLFSAAIESGYVWLALVGVLNSAISLYYYIRVVVFVYLRRETIGSEPTTSPSLALALGLAIAVTIVFGVYPRLLFEMADVSARSLGLTSLAASLR